MSSNDTDNYTLYVAADLTNNVSHVYVGVQASNGLYSLTQTVICCEAAAVYSNTLSLSTEYWKVQFHQHIT